MQFIENDPKSLPPGIAHSVSFTSITMTPQTYLRRLIARFKSLQPDSKRCLHRFHLPSLSALSSPPLLSLLGSPPSLIVNCTGIGALTLGGVADDLVHPIRGHVVKVRAPWVREGFTRQIGALGGAEGGQRTYVIPRPDGDVILGGTREVGNWNPYPLEETRRDILQRAVEICPALIPARKLAPSLSGQEIPPQRLEALSNDPEVIRKQAGGQSARGGHPLEELITGEIVGFRPQRHGGIRLEVGQKVRLGEKGPSEMALLHNYGHGGAGWQSCWGCAEDVAKLAQEALQPVRAKL